MRSQTCRNIQVVAKTTLGFPSRRRGPDLGIEMFDASTLPVAVGHAYFGKVDLANLACINYPGVHVAVYISMIFAR